MSPSQKATLRFLKASEGPRRSGKLSSQTLGHLVRQGWVSVEVKTEVKLRPVRLRYRLYAITEEGRQALEEKR